MAYNNKVFIATSLDGYIADKNGNIDWLNDIPNPDNEDMGYNAFIENIDALVMGRATFEKVLSFGIEWPYGVPVFVASHTMTEVPEGYESKVELVAGSPSSILETIREKGHKNLYIDGGKLIQAFLNEDLIDEICISTIPILLGGGFPLFGQLKEPLKFELIKTDTYLSQLTQSKYRRKR
ncbi:diacylglycerol kinase [Fulvitalea axinellae]|uniref:Diacylglycerol kinase n=1 Tax=Fulvitalea axinellae TaxID=1182444 RepID=A0AAU9D761_9BACT|nr:diacylglycerol kinase [Fulvitalea axinellae]